MKIETHSCDTGDCLLCRQGVPRVPASSDVKLLAPASFAHCTRGFNCTSVSATCSCVCRACTETRRHDAGPR